MRLSFETAARSHVGHVRQANEDSHLAREADGLWVVADGMGGHARGDYASQLVTGALAALALAAEPAERRRAVGDAITACHRRLQEEAAEHGISGCTVAALLAQDGTHACLWAGDSRIYRLRQGRLEPLTSDHNLAHELVAAGRLSAEEARHHPLSNSLTRAVGAEEALELDVVEGRIEPGDVFLLCSDGLTGELEDDAIARRLGSLAPAAAADALIGDTLRAGARDNVTVIVVRCDAAPGAS